MTRCVRCGFEAIELRPTFKVQFMERLRAIRVRQRITQRQLAARAGVCQSVVSKAERGEDVPDLATVRKLARGLNVGLATLSRAEGVLDDPFVFAVGCYLRHLSAKQWCMILGRVPSFNGIIPPKGAQGMKGEVIDQ